MKDSKKPRYLHQNVSRLLLTRLKSKFTMSFYDQDQTSKERCEELKKESNDARGRLKYFNFEEVVTHDKFSNDLLGFVYLFGF